MKNKSDHIIWLLRLNVLDNNGRERERERDDIRPPVTTGDSCALNNEKGRGLEREREGWMKVGGGLILLMWSLYDILHKRRPFSELFQDLRFVWSNQTAKRSRLPFRDLQAGALVSRRWNPAGISSRTITLFVCSSDVIFHIVWKRLPYPYVS